MKKYSIHLKQAGLIILEALRDGFPEEHLSQLLEVADKGYLLGYADGTMKMDRNKIEYNLETIKELIQNMGMNRKN